jgi:hypothetical protein
MEILTTISIFKDILGVEPTGYTKSKIFSRLLHQVTPEPNPTRTKTYAAHHLVE